MVTFVMVGKEEVREKKGQRGVRDCNLKFSLASVPLFPSPLMLSTSLLFRGALYTLNTQRAQQEKMRIWSRLLRDGI